MPALLLTIGARDLTGAAFGAVTSSIGSLARISGAAFGAATAAAAGLAVAVVRAARSLDDIGVRARNAGVPPDVLQSYRLLASEVGVAANVADTALQRFNRRVGEVANGTGTLAPVFERLGIEVRDAAGNVRESAEILPEFISALGGIEATSQRAAAAMAAFDTEAVGLGLGLAEIGDNISSRIEDFRELGLILEQDLIEGAQAANTSFGLLGDVFRTATQRGLGALAPALGNLAEVVARTVGPAMAEFSMLVEVNENILVDFGRSIIEFAQTASTSFLQFVANVAGAIAGLTQQVDTTVASLGAILTILGQEGLGMTAIGLATNLRSIGEAAQSAEETFNSLAASTDNAFDSALRRYDEAANRLSGAGQRISESALEAVQSGVDTAVPMIQSQFERSVAQGLRAGAEEGGRGLLNFLRDRILNSIFDSLAGGITNALSGIGSGGGGGGILGGIFGGLFGGGRQRGGGVGVGQFYLIGENGPELFAPGQSGEVLPLTAGGRPSGELAFNVTNNFTGNVRDDADRVALAQEVENRTVARIVDLQRRGRL